MHQQEHFITVKLANSVSCRSQYDKVSVFDGLISRIFLAPEIREKIPEDLRDIPDNANQYTMECELESDVFCVGWILWAILTQKNWIDVLKRNAKNLRKGWVPCKEFSSEQKGDFLLVLFQSCGKNNF